MKIRYLFFVLCLIPYFQLLNGAVFIGEEEEVPWTWPGHEPEEQPPL